MFVAVGPAVIMDSLCPVPVAICIVVTHGPRNGSTWKIASTYRLIANSSSPQKLKTTDNARITSVLKCKRTFSAGIITL